MTRTYTVWIEIEMHDTANDTYENMSDSLGFAGTASFDTLEEALEYAAALHGGLDSY